MRGQFINGIFWNNFNEITFKVAPHLKEAINDFTNTKEAADGTKAKINVKDSKSGVSYQEYGHISDLTDYLICEVFKIDFKLFQSGGITSFKGSVGSREINEKMRL